METPLTLSVPTDGSQRRRRIAELLHKAISELESTQPSSPSDSSTPASSNVTPAAELSDPERVVRFLRITGESSPATIRTTLGLSRSGAFRVLQSLAHAQRIVSHGQTRTLVYRLNEREPPPDRLALN
jgi:recombinational DNA repair ATPase RecF